MQIIVRILIVLAKIRILGSRIYAALNRRIGRLKSQVSTLEQHNRLFRTAADRLGYQHEQLSKDILQIRNGAVSCYVSSSNFSFESLTAYWICGHKYLASKLLEKNSLPVPEFSHLSAEKYNEALKIFESFPKPVVVKPVQGSSANGVTVAIETESDFRKAFIRAGSICPDILIERFISGQHWRVTMLDGELLVAWQRIPAHVVGDGVRSIAELVRAHNAKIDVWDEFPTGKPILLNDAARRDLATQNFHFKSVLEPGEIAQVHLACNDGLGGWTVNITDRIHPGYVDISRRAAEIVGAKLAGIDLIADDITIAPSDGCFFINEVNTTPGLISPNYATDRRTSAVDYAEKVLQYALR
jgi:cyanophycin synthetase